MSRDLTRLSHQNAIQFYRWEPFMVSYHFAKFDGHRHCDSGDMMFLVVEREDSTCVRLHPPLLFISKANGMPCWPKKFHEIGTIICRCVQGQTSDQGDKCLQEQLTEINSKNFVSPSKKSTRKNANCKAFGLHVNTINA